MNGDVRIAADPAALARQGAGEFAAAARDAVAARGVCSIVLAGGATPRRLYTLLAGDPDYRAGVPWGRIHFFWGDERWVPPDHRDSNYRMAHEAMLSRVEVPAAHMHRIRTELPDAVSAAAAYEETLREFAGSQERGRPLFDLVLLGMGDDGHTASLFPGADALRETARRVVAPWVEALRSHRVTLTVTALRDAASVVFLVSGADKAVALQAVLEAPAPDEMLPASLIRPIGGRLTWLVDQDAARLLRR